MMKKFSIVLLLFLLIASVQLFVQQKDNPDRQKISQLIQQFRELKYGDWSSMSGKFKEIGDPVIEPLKKLLRKNESGKGAERRIEWNQRSVAWILGDVGTDNAINFLVEMVQDLTLHLWGRIQAVQTLGRLNV